MIVTSGIILLLAILVFVFMQHPNFGKSPNGKRLELIKQSPNFKDDKFHNQTLTPNLTEGYTMTKLIWEFMVGNYPRTKPTDTIPAIKTDLKNLPVQANVLLWFGHSSYFIQLNGKRFLVDPVFSGNASPIPASNKSFIGTDIYTADDMPEIDYLLISHDHYDHLDYETIIKLKPKFKHIVCGLGVGSHFEQWKFDSSKIIEKDWNEKVIVDGTITLHTATARHFSGRGFTRNNTLWLSFILDTPNYKMYLGGDSGYDTHFSAIGEKFDGFDLAILENGQYNQAWHQSHMLPEEVLKAANDLKAKRVFPVHSSKFKLAFHPWDEPLNLLTEYNDAKYHLPLVTPKIGEVVYLDDTSQKFERWWAKLE